MKFLDKFGLALFSIIVLSISLIFCMTIFNWSDIEVLYKLENTLLMHETVKNFTLGISIFLIILSLKCIFFNGYSKENKEKKEGILLENENGKLLISIDTIENLTSRVVKSFNTENYEVKKFTVKFVGVNDEVISEVEVEYGKDVTLPNAPTIEGYEFKDFSHDGKNITEDITIKLNYEKVNSSNPVTSDCKTGSLIKLMFTLFATFTFAYIFKKH